MAPCSDAESQGLSVSVLLTGFPEDLLTLAMLFPEGRLPNVFVTTQVIGRKDGLMDRVSDASNTETVLEGPGCVRLTHVPHFESARWTALEILAPLNGFASLADANFVPVQPVSASFAGGGVTGHIDLRPSVAVRRHRLISADRVPQQRAAMPSRVELMSSNPLAAYAGAVIAATPSWTDYYRVLEDIAAACGTDISKLHQTGLISHALQREFTKAANNRMNGRHGASGRKFDGDERDLMNLLEAREVVRRVVSGWMDCICGGYLPRDRVDGPALRFGLDNHD